MKAKSRQAHRDGAGTAPKIQSVQRPCGLREKVQQVGKGEIEAQPALGRLEVSGVLRCAGLEPFEVVIGDHFLHAPLRRSRPVRVAGAPASSATTTEVRTIEEVSARLSGRLLYRGWRARLSVSC